MGEKLILWLGFICTLQSIAGEGRKEGCFGLHTSPTWQEPHKGDPFPRKPGPHMTTEHTEDEFQQMGSGICSGRD